MLWAERRRPGKAVVVCGVIAASIAFNVVVQSVGRVTDDPTLSALLLVSWGALVACGVWWVGRKAFVPWLARRVGLASFEIESMQRTAVRGRLKWAALVLVGIGALWLLGVYYVAPVAEVTVDSANWGESAAMIVVAIGAAASFGWDVLAALLDGL